MNKLVINKFSVKGEGEGCDLSDQKRGS